MTRDEEPQNEFDPQEQPPTEVLMPSRRVRRITWGIGGASLLTGVTGIVLMAEGAATKNPDNIQRGLNIVIGASAEAAVGALVYVVAMTKALSSNNPSNPTE